MEHATENEFQKKVIEIAANMLEAEIILQVLHLGPEDSFRVSDESLQRDETKAKMKGKLEGIRKLILHGC
jgi:hypothetical protein